MRGNAMSKDDTPHTQGRTGDEDSGPFDDPATPLSGAATIDTLLPEGTGRQIGPYKLLQLIGEGGFGSVFLAEQTEPVKRRVALKVIKLGMDTRQVVARFEQERQALAMMDHPGIAKVLDAGATETGQPYFVMELVDGLRVTEHCDRHSLSIAARLELFGQICSAVQHAHTKGIIHRDLKPSNVLVSVHDGQPRVKVIDFGIAKATAGNLTEKTLFTGHRQLIGTPEYMSPEQAEGSLDIDTRTDVYALGVLLYELLTGDTPVDSRRLRSAAFAEIARIIREVDPPSPSSRLSQSADTLVNVAARRRTEPAKLSSILRGELDWIVMKALEKDRQRRYETASGLALDIRRYLAGEPVSAAPPSKVYRFRKFVRRHRAPVAATSLVAAALVAAVVGISWQARVARAERDKAERIAEFMSDMLQGVEPGVARGRDTTMLKEMMTAAATRIEKGDLARTPEAELRLRGTIGTAFRELALYDEASKMLAPAVPLARSLRKGDHAETAEALSDLAQLLNDTGDLTAAEPLYREALAMDQRLYPGDDSRVATDINNLAQLLDDKGDSAAAEPLARQALEMRRRLYPGDHEDVAESLNNLAGLMIGGGRGTGDVEGAEKLYREVLAMSRRLYGGDHPRLAGSINNLAVLLKNKGDLAGAEPLARETLEMRRRLFPGDHPYVATGLNNLALLIQDRGDLVSPEPLFRESLAMRRRLYPAGHMSTATDLGNLARLLLDRGDAAAAEPLYREAAEMYERTNGKDFWPAANARLGLGRTLARLGRFRQAEPEFLASERVFAAAPGVAERHEKCVEALVEFYGSWDVAEPGRGHGLQAAKWKATPGAAKSPAAR
ncbi:MAG: serine/threonine protein kinase [Holophagales bacterium]|nr:serine/threonine protein kinase [Holophagales bacterium]